MNFENLLYLTKEFKKLAGLKDNMAKRIMFSLLSRLAPVEQVVLTKGMVDFNALKSLIPGAKELIKYGLKACAEEANHFTDMFYDLTSYEQKDKYNSSYDLKIKFMAEVESENYKQACEIGITIFSDKVWNGRNYGGKAWLKIIETIQQIYLYLQKYYENKTDYDAQQEALMNMTVYMNILDGITHNTDSLAGKLLDKEFDDLYPDPHMGSLSDSIEAYNKKNQEYTELAEKAERDNERYKHLLNIKQLENPDDVIEELLPIIAPSRGIPQSGLKDWIQKARRMERNPSSPEEREKMLDKIKLKKQLHYALSELDKKIKEVNKNLNVKNMRPVTLFLSKMSTLNLTELLTTSGLSDVKLFIKIDELSNILVKFARLTNTYVSDKELAANSITIELFNKSKLLANEIFDSLKELIDNF